MHENTTTTTTIPAGLCQCGCGRGTNIVTQTNHAKGRIKGQYSRFVRGHNNRRRDRYTLIDMGMDTPCMIWKLALQRNGYGVDSVASGKKVLAHRRAYEARFGPIPPDRQLDHLCRMPACVNPDHLEPVTSAENVRRGSATKVNAKIVMQIRSSTERQDVLGRRYGITQSQVSRIKSGHSWRDVGG